MKLSVERPDALLISGAAEVRSRRIRVGPLAVLVLLLLGLALWQATPALAGEEGSPGAIRPCASDGETVSIYGVVTDASTDEPIPGARIALIRDWPGGMGPPGEVNSTVADDEGDYAFYDVEPYPDTYYHLGVEADGYAPVHWLDTPSFLYEGTPVEMNFTLEPPAGPPAVTGIVVDDIGVGITQADVFVEYIEEPQADSYIARNADGTFAIWGIEAGREFRVVAEGNNECHVYNIVRSEIFLFDGIDPIYVDLVLRYFAFPDLSCVCPYCTAINDVASRGIISGYTNGNFGPDDSVIRQQFAKMIVGTAGYPVSESDICPFMDVALQMGTDPLYPSRYVSVAAAHAITVGNTATTFDPYGNISRYQVVTMAVRTVDDLAPGTLAPPPPEYGTWQADATHGANAARAEYGGLMQGLNLATLGPYDAMPRGEVAQILHNLIQLLGL